MAEPGEAGWKWFPNVKDSWSLDVVTLLAVIGESSMAEHSQAITASLLCLLPRILPAPQALLKPSRPSRMPETNAKMTGVYSGTTLDSVGFFANIITPLDALPVFSFKVLEIKHADLNEVAGIEVPAVPAGDDRSWLSRWRRRRSKEKHSQIADKTLPPTGEDLELGGQQGRSSTVVFSSSAAADHEPKPLKRRDTQKKVQDLLANPTMANKNKSPAVPAKLFSPIHILSVCSCLLSVAIIAAGVVWKDGCAILAVTLVSLASSVVGYASFWHPILMNRKHNNAVPKGDVMIRTREGAFVLIRCTEEVARELYSGTEECRYYVGDRPYRALMALGTILLMLSVVLLGNCTWNSQIFIGGSYIVLNGLYWALGMLPRERFWDLSRYQWRDVTPKDARNAHEVTDADDQREGHPSFTRTLWYAIRETGRTGWVERSGAAPGTDQWKQWLREAEENALTNRSWKAVERKDAVMKAKVGEVLDQAAQHAPATEVTRPSAGEAGWNQQSTF